MRRVVVVGPPGSGKTTLAVALSRITGVPAIELDGLWWDPGWTEVGEQIFRTRVGPVVAQDRWILDGNYFSVGSREAVWPRADTIVWLDLPRRVTVPRIVRRTISRGLLRTELWSGNRESIRMALRPDSIVAFAWTSHPKYRLRYEGLQGDAEFAHLSWVRLRSPREVRGWLRSRRTKA